MKGLKKNTSMVWGIIFLGLAIGAIFYLSFVLTGKELFRDIVHIVNLLVVIGLVFNIRYESAKREKIMAFLKTQNTQLLMVFDELPFGLLTEEIDTGEITYWNQWLADNTQISKDEAFGKCSNEIFKFEDFEHVKTLKAEDKFPVYEGVYIDANQTERIYQVAKIEIEGFSDLNIRIIVVNDVTDYRHLEKKVLQSDKMNAIGQLAGGIAHDFNNQLMGIAGHASLLLATSEGKSKVHVEKILHQTGVASELVHKLLTFSNQNIHFEKLINIQNVIDHVLASFHDMDKKTVQIKKISDAPNCFALGDEAFIESAFLNIIKNAYEAIELEGTINIALYEKTLNDDDRINFYQEISSGAYCIVEIEDSGKGVAENEISKWFEPFYTTKPFGEGHGMGLSAVYGTITKHNGGIKVESHPNKGTKFTVALPLVKQGEFEKSHKIAVLDDDEIVCELLEAVLIENGYVSIKLANRLEDLNLEDIFLLITDRNVHEDFQAFLRTTFKKYPEIKVIGISGYFTEEDFRLKNLYTNLELLEKPIETRLLNRKIESLFR